MNRIQLSPGDDFAQAVGKLADGAELSLPRGGVFDISRTAGIPHDNIRITSHGDATLPRPIVRAHACGAIVALSRRNVSVSQIQFQGIDDPGDKGLFFYKCHGVAAEDLDVGGFLFGITAEGQSSDIAIRRCFIHDNFHPQRKHSSGLYASGVMRLIIEHNIFDTNGWKPSAPSRAATVFNHNCYLQSDNGPAIARGNIFANASSHGLQQRCGGMCEGNVFLDNPIHHSYGLVNGAAGFVGGVSGTIRGNVYVGSRDIAGAKRGWAIELANLLKLRMSDLFIAHDRQNNAAAIQVSVPRDVSNAKQLVGIVDLEIAPSVYTWDWPRGVFGKNPGISISETGMKKLGRLAIPQTWAQPPVAADLTRIVNLPAVRALAGGAITSETAAGLIRACRMACALESVPPPLPEPEPIPSPNAPDVPGALAAAREARDCLPGDVVLARRKLDQVIDLLT